MTGKTLVKGTWVEVLRLGASVGAILLMLWIYNTTQVSNITTKLGEIDTHLAVIEANRFTAAEGLAVWQAIADVREHVASLPQEAPPRWLIARLDRIDKEITRLHTRLDNIEDR
jgi:hypothetical protein